MAAPIVGQPRRKTKTARNIYPYRRHDAGFPCAKFAKQKESLGVKTQRENDFIRDADQTNEPMNFGSSCHD